MTGRLHPHLYEINTRVWLKRLQESRGTTLTLGTLPDEEWIRLQRLGFDYVWLMGVWSPSKRSAEIARLLPFLQSEYDGALPQWNESDVIGSPYSVASYALNPSLGSPEDLGVLHDTLHRHGLGLILDFVPNHTALDHPWTSDHPEYFVQGDLDEYRRNPHLFFQAETEGTRILAHGRDPYFPPWTDTAQLNLFKQPLRDAFSGALRGVAKNCDGVRCDMAMLALNEKFEQTWGWLVRRFEDKLPAEEFWETVIRDARSDEPDFIFMAEAYGGYEKKLLDLGFDYVYDKTLYDHLLRGNPPAVRSHLLAGAESQGRFVRFIENHDERRAVQAFGRQKSKAAAAVVSTLPGMRLLHDGQIDGRRMRIPLQLARAQHEADDPELLEFYSTLLRFADHPTLHVGKWLLLNVGDSSADDHSNENLVAWMWSTEDDAKIVVVNLADGPSQGLVAFPREAPGHQIKLLNELTGEPENLDQDPLAGNLLRLALGPFQVKLFTVLTSGPP